MPKRIARDLSRAIALLMVVLIISDGLVSCCVSGDDARQNETGQALFKVVVLLPTAVVTLPELAQKLYRGGDHWYKVSLKRGYLGGTRVGYRARDRPFLGSG